MNQNEIAEAEQKRKKLREREAYRDFKQFTYKLTGRSNIHFSSFRRALYSLKKHMRVTLATDWHMTRTALEKMRKAYTNADTWINAYTQNLHGELNWSVFVSLEDNIQSGALWVVFLRKAHDEENDKEEALTN